MRGVSSSMPSVGSGGGGWTAWQRGDEALKADNVFYPLTYEGAVGECWRGPGRALEVSRRGREDSDAAVRWLTKEEWGEGCYC